MRENEINTEEPEANEKSPIAGVSIKPWAAIESDPLWQRLGQKAILILIGSLLIQVIAMSFIGWLIYGDISKQTWHAIVLNGWAARSLTLTSLTLRIAVALQGALALSMLAAITLERIAVPLKSVAELSFIRAGVKTDPLSILLSFIYPMYKHDPFIRRGTKKGFRGFVLGFVLAILATVTLSQFASTALLGDLSLQPIPGHHRTTDVLFDYPFTNAAKYRFDPTTYLAGSGSYRYGFTYPALPAISYWQTKTPPTWPAFAEYSEPPPSSNASVSDTGMSVRAFLPFASAADRQSLRNYTGKAVVMDSRVTCQKPSVGSISFGRIATNNFTKHEIEFGNIQLNKIKPTTQTPLQNPLVELDDDTYSCLATTSGQNDVVVWTICQPMPPYDNWVLKQDQKKATLGLKSTLRDSSANQTGSTFILMVTGEDLSYAGVPMDTADSPYVSFQPKSADFKVGLTLCYAAFDVAERYVEMYSEVNRTEPSAQWDMDNLSLNMSDVINQLDTGYVTTPPGSKIPTPESRGVLKMKKRDWTDTTPDLIDLDGPDQLPYVKGGWQTLDVRGSDTAEPAWLRPFVIEGMRIQGGVPGANENIFTWNAVLAANLTLTSSDRAGSLQKSTTSNTVISQDWITELFMGLKKDPAVALQAVLTSVAGVAYYDRIAQYVKSTPAGQVFFVTAESPGGPFGQKRKDVAKGFVAVIVVLLLHLILVAIVLAGFIRYSRITRIGDVWQAVSQFGLSEECRPIMHAASSSNPGGKKTVENMLHQRKVNVLLASHGESAKFERSEAH